ncbi:serine/threonine-protein kinase [Actinomadura sp. 21ATH]|uniref:serine/threonine-protein kinase n=1 Tax=Actinomadura sp. 21ATH TaxID=1735444 RepID=UPI0035C22A94
MQEAEGADLPARARPLRPDDPRTIGPYTVAGALAGGGMGRVFLGRGPDGALVAIKVIRAELAGEPEFRARFRREARSAMRVPRFCTAEVIAADPDAPEPYLVTEYIDGPTLEEAVRADGPLRGADLDQLGVSIAAALAGIHSAGIIHRDLKPANVLLSRTGPRVIDFGVAGAAGATRLTGDGTIHGTPAYMAPEQLQARPEPASDVFSWGGVMLFAATGRRPFGGATLPVMAVRIMEEEPDLGGLTGALRDAVAAALGKDPAGRPTPARLLEMLRTSGEDLAVRTRAERAIAVTTRTDPAAAEREPEPPGTVPAGTVPPGTGLPEPWQTTWTPPPSRSRARRRRRRRALWALTVPASLALIAGGAAWSLREARTPELAVTGVDVRAGRPALGCDAEVQVTGVLTTNGAPGRIVYQWKRSDQEDPDPPLQQDMAGGRAHATVHLDWDVKGTGTRTFTATLTVLNGPPMQGSASFTYSCED